MRRRRDDDDSWMEDPLVWVVAILVLIFLLEWCGPQETSAEATRYDRRAAVSSLGRGQDAARWEAACVLRKSGLLKGDDSFRADLECSGEQGP